MAPTKTPRRTPASELRSLARSLPSVEEGVACEGTKLEATTFRVGPKAFLFLREKDARLRLGSSLAEARRLAASSPSVRIGGTGWVTIDLAEAHALVPTLSVWVRESHGLAATKSDRPGSPRSTP